MALLVHARQLEHLPVDACVRRDSASCTATDSTVAGSSVQRLSTLQASFKPLTVTIVDRPYEAGRHILNVQELESKIRGKWPGSQVSVEHVEGMNLRQQIALFQHTSILIWTHGAAMADLLFLPQVLQAFALPKALCLALVCSHCLTLTVRMLAGHATDQGIRKLPAPLNNTVLAHGVQLHVPASSIYAEICVHTGTSKCRIADAHLSVVSASAASSALSVLAVFSVLYQQC